MVSGHWGRVQLLPNVRSFPTMCAPAPALKEVGQMADQVQFNLQPDDLPTAWYNILPDMAAQGMPPLPPLHPGTHEPVTPDLLLALFPESLVMQEVSAEPAIDIPGPILD